LKAWKLTPIILIILTTSGCALSKGMVKESQNNKVVDTYLEAVSKGRTDSASYIRENLKINQAFGYVRPYVPVMEQADVRSVWIPAHKSKEDPNTLISGHWVYIVVRESRWFIDAQKNSNVKIPLIIPYKGKSQK
jgi:hypothetical protein